MKTILKSILLICVIATSFVSCETYKEPTIDHSPIFPISGEWRVRIKNLSTNTLVAQSMYTLGTYNTTNNDKDSMWVRTISNIPTFSSAAIKTLKAKIFCDVSSLSFTTVGITKNLHVSTNAIVDTIVITEGKITLNAIKMPSGVTSDKISFELTKTKAPGVTFLIEGYRKTLWAEDENFITF